MGIRVRGYDEASNIVALTYTFANPTDTPYGD
jgi:hypothetical protein